MADGKTDEAIEVRELLLHLLDKEIIFCPLAAPTIWELRKQAGRSFRSTSEFMERLSLNITFRGIEQIFDHELSNFLEYLLTNQFKPLSHNELFGPLRSYIGPEYVLEAEIEIDTNKIENKKIIETFGKYLTEQNLTSFVKKFGEKSSPRHRLCQNGRSLKSKEEMLRKETKIT